MGAQPEASDTPTSADSGSPRSVQTWTCALRGRRYELTAWGTTNVRLVLRVDGREVYDKKEMDDNRTIRLDGGRRVTVKVGATGKIKQATVVDNGIDMDFDAPAGTRAARMQEWGRQHPVLFALRHVAVKGGGILIALLGLGALFKALIEPVIDRVVDWIAEHMPHIDIPWPDIHLPEIPWPDIPWPEIRLPRIPWPDLPPPPDWVLAILEWLAEHEDIIKPLFIGLVLALMEMRRLRRQRKLREAGATTDPAAAPPTKRPGWLARLDTWASDTSAARTAERARLATAMHALVEQRSASVDDRPGEPSGQVSAPERGSDER